MTVAEIIHLKESEDRVEFKEAKNQYPYKSGKRSVLGYVTALANEKGGFLIFGIKESSPHEICGSSAWENMEGKLEQDIYSDLKIRVETEVLKEDGKRVLIIKVPPRPVGKPLYFDDVPLMRVGESLVRMSDEMYLSIIQEQEPDFSSKICEQLTLSDLDDNALYQMKVSYANKQNNEVFLQISNEQMLSDLKLLANGKLTFAALILLGKFEKISQYLPQSKIIWEFRNTESQIHHDRREVIEAPLFLGLDNVWKLINQPTLNLKHPIQTGAYIFDIFDFNEAVIREGLLNAVAHRDYTLTSEVVVKQFPGKIEINNPGGFPKGVTIDNLLTVSSTPRNRLITEILEKTGLVERSGQGVDKIYSITLSEGKNQPDYTDSSSYQISLKIKSEIKDKAFHLFISQHQIVNNQRLGVEQIITLSKVRDGHFLSLKSEIIDQLKSAGLIKSVAGSALKYTLSDDYFAIQDEDSRISDRYVIKEIEHILLSLQGVKKQVGVLEKNLSKSLNRNQIKYLLQKLLEDGILKKEGKGKGTKYSIAKDYNELRNESLISDIVSKLKEKYS